ncbi:MAG TPA: DUF4157 domain-containing protein [Streptosporangiaceae bacterium]|nr:DUF4157 domain-containing protein [Streptosporangiaceae bacterium]
MAGNAAVSRLLAQRRRESVQTALAVPGRRLPVGVLADMGDRLDANFSDVRVHTGRAADDAARDLEANAFTTGSHVVIRHGKYDPASASGKRVLAHELVHVLQQRQGPVHGTGDVLKLSDPSDRFERQADQVARAVTGHGHAMKLTEQGHRPTRRSAAASFVGRIVQRDWKGETHVHYGPLKDDCGTWMVAELHPDTGVGGVPKVRPDWWADGKPDTKSFLSKYMVQGHLLNMKLSGPGNTMKNLTPLTKSANSAHLHAVESSVKKAVNDDGEIVTYFVEVDYSSHPTGEELVGKKLPGISAKARKKLVDDLEDKYCGKLAVSMHCQYDTVNSKGKVTKQHQPWTIWNIRK